MSDRFLQLEKDMRRAVLCHRYADIQAIASQLGAQAVEDWRAIHPDGAGARLIFARLEEMLEWARLMTCMARASRAAELRRLRQATRFKSNSYSCGSHLRCDI